MSDGPEQTRFASRGRLHGVLRRPAGGGPAEALSTQPAREGSTAEELDTQAFEALYYRARLVLGEPLPRAARYSRRAR